MSTINTDLLAVSRAQVTRITGAKLATVDYWAATGLVRPDVDTRLTPGRIIRQYSFSDLMSLLVIQELRRRKVSLQHIRLIVGALRDEGFTEPLTQIGYAEIGGYVFLQYPDGSWFEGKEPAQQVMAEVLDLEPLRTAVRERASRNRETVGHVERRRGALGSKELVAGTRIPVATVQRYLDSGRTDAQIMDSFPDLKSEDIAAVRTITAA